MGRIRRLDGTVEYPLEPEHLVGRSPQCSLLLGERYISGQHCVIRWTGHLWQVLDRGSRNGTRVDGQRLNFGCPYDLKEGSIITMGHVREQWVLVDPSGPQVMLVCEQTRFAIPEQSGRIVLTSSCGSRYELRRAKNASWWLFQGDQVLQSVEPGAVLDLHGRRFRFVCPHSVNATCAQEDLLGSPVIEFDVSLEQEFVRVLLHNAERTYSLGSRTFNSLLLYLAKERLADQAAGRPAGECGWIYKSQLATAMHYSPQQVDGDVHRLKRHLERLSLFEAGELIERRRGTTQLRLALSHIRIRDQGGHNPALTPGGLDNAEPTGTR